MNWLLWKHHAIKNAKLIGLAVLIVVTFITVVILTVYLMSLNVVASLVSLTVVGWLVATSVDYIKASR